MTPEAIERLFVTAAEIEKRLPPMGERPARLKAQAIPYFHSATDIKGWGGERYQEERADFLSERTTRLRTSDVSRWELCNELIAFVPRERDRRCLWAWAMAEAGALRAPKVIDGTTVSVKISFSRWCSDVEGIHRNTGKTRKDVAVSCIAAVFARNTLSDIRKLQNTTLQNAPEISDKSINIEEPRKWSWMAAGAFSAVAVPEAQDFSWVERRNEMRRKREAARE